jgi:hypothetical protein
MNASSSSALRRSFNGLSVVLANGSHSPPNERNSSTSGPSAAATMARAPAYTRARAMPTAVRASTVSRSDGMICNTAAPANVRGRIRAPSTSAAVVAIVAS